MLSFNEGKKQVFLTLIRVRKDDVHYVNGKTLFLYPIPKKKKKKQKLQRSEY